MRIIDLPMYKSLAIGLNVKQKDWLQHQLQIVKDNAMQRDLKFKVDAKDVNLGFVWDSTPQGHDFWSTIHDAYQLRVHRHGN